MGVEAALQAAEIHTVDTSLIRSFEFRDVLLPAALIVPDDDQGVELITSLHPEKGFAGRSQVPWRFSVTSVMRTGEDDVFTEHCHGRVSYSFTSSGQFAPHPLLSVVSNLNGRFARSTQTGHNLGTKACLLR